LASALPDRVVGGEAGRSGGGAVDDAAGFGASDAYNTPVACVGGFGAFGFGGALANDATSLSKWLCT
jgi:hypothetical protein